MFVKGKSGNPGGRMKSKVTAWARLHTREAINTAVEIMMNKEEEASARLTAVKVILERGWGRPKEEVALTGAGGGPILTQAVDAPKQQAYEEWIERIKKEQEDRKPVH